MSARLFVAVDLPATVRGELAEFASAVAANDEALRAVGPDALHITLAFLGQRDEGDVEATAAALRAAAPKLPLPLPLELGGVLWLAPRRPHVLTVGIGDPDEALAAVQPAVVEALNEAIGWQPERRPFRPHVTVARVRRGARPQRDALPESPQGAFEATALTLYRSHVGGGPARYEALERVAL